MEFKKIGAQKYKNKSKYKDKSKVVPKQQNNLATSAKEGSKLESNWYRYQNRDDDDEPDSSRDFALLSKTPISHGNYLFKGDKELIEDSSQKVRNDKFFELDLDLLEHSLATIPFNIRIGIDEHYFNNDQIEDFKSKSVKAQKTYEALLKRDKYEKIQEYVSDIGSLEKEIADQLSFQSDGKGMPMELEKPEIDKPKQDEDLEQWLDDFLDD